MYSISGELHDFYTRVDYYSYKGQENSFIIL